MTSATRPPKPAVELLEDVLRTAADEWDQRMVSYIGRIYAGLAFDASVSPAEGAYMIKILVNVVRRHFPMGFYRQNTNWELWSAALLVRMTETVESAMVLMKDDHEPDGRILVRAPYEQVVTYAWIAIDPGPHWRRWFNQGLWDDLNLHNDAMTFGERTLNDEEVEVTKTRLGLDRPRPGRRRSERGLSQRSCFRR